MQLTSFSDYAIRVLMYVAMKEPGLSSITEVADAHKIARPHVVKIVHELGRGGYLETQRGRSGGIRLAVPATEINLGALIRFTEKNLALVDCMGGSGTCVVVSACGLQTILRKALDAFFEELGKHTLADILGPAHKLRQLMALPDPL